MTTQTLRGMANNGSMHWRGDRTGGNDPGGSAGDEVAAFKKFNGAFASLLGRSGPLTDNEMQAFADFALALTLPPNPIRALDDSLTPAQDAGRQIYFTRTVDSLTCAGCHVLSTTAGFFGTDGRASFENEPQHFKIPHLRNMYAKAGMFGMPAVPFTSPGDNGNKGDQIRGFGYLHDGSMDTLFRFFRATVFNFHGRDPERRQMEQFMFAVDSDLKPVVGQQVTLTTLNAAAASPRIDLLVSQAGLGNCDLVVKGRVAGQLPRLGPPAGWPVPQRPAVRGSARRGRPSQPRRHGRPGTDLELRPAGLRDPHRRRPGRGRPVRPGRQLSVPRER